MDRKYSNATCEFLIFNVINHKSPNLVQQWSPLGDIRSKESIVNTIHKTAHGLSNAFAIEEQPEDLIYNLFKLPNKDEASIGKLMTVSSV